MKEGTKKRIGKIFRVIRNSLFLSIATLLSAFVAGAFLFLKFWFGFYEESRFALIVSLAVCLVCIGTWRLLLRRVEKVYLAIFLSLETRNFGSPTFLGTDNSGPQRN